MNRRAINPETIEKQVREYFKHCDESVEVRELKNGDKRIRKESPSIIGLAVWLDVDKGTIYNLMDKDYIETVTVYSDEDKKLIFNTLSRARERIEQSLLQRAIDGDCDTRIASLLLSTYGYTQKVDAGGAITVRIDGATGDDAGDWSR